METMCADINTFESKPDIEKMHYCESSQDDQECIIIKHEEGIFSVETSSCGTEDDKANVFGNSSANGWIPDKLHEWIKKEKHDYEENVGEHDEDVRQKDAKTKDVNNNDNNLDTMYAQVLRVFPTYPTYTDDVSGNHTDANIIDKLCNENIETWLGVVLKQEQDDQWMYDAKINNRTISDRYYFTEGADSFKTEKSPVKLSSQFGKEIEQCTFVFDSNTEKFTLNNVKKLEPLNCDRPSYMSDLATVVNEKVLQNGSKDPVFPDDQAFPVMQNDIKLGREEQNVRFGVKNQRPSGIRNIKREPQFSHGGQDVETHSTHMGHARKQKAQTGKRKIPSKEKLMTKKKGGLKRKFSQKEVRTVPSKFPKLAHSERRNCMYATMKNESNSTKVTVQSVATNKSKFSTTKSKATLKITKKHLKGKPQIKSGARHAEKNYSIANMKSQFLDNKKHQQGLKEKEQMFKCEVCGKVFAKAAYLSKHFKIHTRVKSEKLDEREKPVTQSDQTMPHNRSLKEEKPKYPVAGVSSGNRQSHKKFNIKENTFKCDLCFKSFAQSGHLASHMTKSHSGKKLFKCGVCREESKDAVSLRKHLLSHTNEGANKRKQSESNLKSSASMAANKTSIKEEKPCICDVCGKAFAQAKILQAHIKTHEVRKLKTHRCHVCSKFFKSGGALGKHLTSHKNGKHLKLSESFNTAPSQKNQNLVESPEKTCTGDMTPVNTPTGLKLFKCPACNKGYTRSWNLKTHNCRRRDSV